MYRLFEWTPGSAPATHVRNSSSSKRDLLSLALNSPCHWVICGARGIVEQSTARAAELFRRRNPEVK